MARARSSLNRFADGLLKILREDAQQNPEDWFTVPRTFRRGVGPEVLSLADPVVCVSLNGSVEPLPGPMGYQTSRVALEIAVLMKNGEADEAVGEMWADIGRVLMSNRQLTGVDDPNNPTILSGFMSLGTSELAARDGSSEGEATLVQQVTIQHAWAATAP
jgi:hypothetical protein